MTLLGEWRDLALDRMRAKGWSPSYEAILGGRIIREVAFIAWCPACQADDHFNHDASLHSSRKPPVPVEGGCWSVSMGELCRCPRRAIGG